MQSLDPVSRLQAPDHRTKHGAEVDLVLDGNFGLLPIEIKLGQTVPQRQLTTLKAFVSDCNAPFAVVINQADKVQMLADRIIQIAARYVT